MKCKPLKIVFPRKSTTNYNKHVVKTYKYTRGNKSRNTFDI